MASRRQAREQLSWWSDSSAKRPRRKQRRVTHASGVTGNHNLKPVLSLVIALPLLALPKSSLAQDVCNCKGGSSPGGACSAGPGDPA